MNAKLVAASIATGRVVLGAALAFAPSRVGRMWVGDASAVPGGKVAVRATGIRDVVVGLGCLMAMRRGGPARGWVEAGMVADAGDFVFTLMSFRHLPPTGRMFTLVMAGSAVASGVIASRRVDTPHRGRAAG